MLALGSVSVVNFLVGVFPGNGSQATPHHANNLDDHFVEFHFDDVFLTGRLKMRIQLDR
jgi:hypothetical protein